MDDNTLNAWRQLAEYGERLNAVVVKLATIFSQASNPLAWKELIYSSQPHYRAARPDQSDLQLYIAERWLQLAEDGCLSVKMDPVRGLIVVETFGNEDVQVHRSDIEKMLFQQVQNLPDKRLLLIHEVQSQFSSLTGQSLLGDYKEDFVALINDLCQKRYIRYDDRNGKGMPRFSKGVAFDDWSRAMTSKPSVPAQTGTTITFNGNVGAVQTGSHSVANVSHSFDSSQLHELKSALQAVLIELNASKHSEHHKDDAKAIVENTLDEIDKPKPSKLTLQALLGGMATSIQTLGSTSDAYKALKVASAAFGITLP
ncbi:hypothetical protein [Pseudomonas cerasi]